MTSFGIGASSGNSSGGGEWKKLMDQIGNKSNYSGEGSAVTRRQFDYVARTSRQPPITMSAFLPKEGAAPALQSYRKEEYLSRDSPLLQRLAQKGALNNSKEAQFQRDRILKSQTFTQQNVPRDPSKRSYQPQVLPDLSQSAAKKSRLTINPESANPKPIPTFMEKRNQYAQSGYNNRTMQKLHGSLNVTNDEKFKFAVGELKKNNRAFKQQPLTT